MTRSPAPSESLKTVKSPLELSGALSGPAASFRQRRPGRYQLGGRTEEPPNPFVGCNTRRGRGNLGSLPTPPAGISDPLVGWLLPSYTRTLPTSGFGTTKMKRSSLTKSIACFEGLEIWLSINSIEREYDNHNRIGSIRYHIPDDIPVRIRNGVEARLVFGLASPSAPLQIPEASIKQTAHLSLKLATAQPLDGFASLAFKFCNFPRLCARPRP